MNAFLYYLTYYNLCITFLTILHRHVYFWKALGESGLIELISQFSELRCERYWFWSEFCCWKFKQITKFGFGRKNQLSPQCVHITEFS
jgi:hypothetical protein